MRTIIILLMFTASLASAEWRDFEEVRELQLDAKGLSSLEIKAGAGSLAVEGVEGADTVIVVATISVPDKSDKKAQAIIAKNLTLSLEKKGSGSILKSYFESGIFGWGNNGSVRLEVRIPGHFSLEIDDSSGSIVIADVSGDIALDDSSGSIKMSRIGGSVDIVDSSGSISVSGVGEDIDIEDGSGSIVVRDVNGSVTIDDGSGSVTVKDVGRDLIITESGSGSVNYSNIRGRVETDG